MLIQEIKGSLAKLLATENLTVEHCKCETASFDVKNRVLSLPLWIASETVYDMLVGHEVGHALFTPADGWESMTGVPKSYVNILEDVRIEKSMKDKFPGLRKDFFKGYRELNQKDFFGIGMMDLNKLKLIDRINLYYKVGIVDQTIPIPFKNEEEKKWLALADLCESFEDVCQLAAKIYEWQGEQEEDQEHIDNAPSTEDDGGDAPQMDTVETETSQDDDGDAQQPQPNPQANSDSTSDDWDEDDNLKDDEQISREGGFNYDEGITDRNFEDNLKEIAEQESYRTPTYADVPEVNLSHLVIKPDHWVKVLTDFWGQDIYSDPSNENYIGIDFSKVDSDYASFKKKCNQEVNYMVKEFECRKAASAYARASVSKTGVLDTTKLHTYKYNDDIFRKIMSTPDGKNHGLVFLLDWSGSMYRDIHQTVKQLLSLAYFCRKVNIPFRVYAFSDAYWEGDDTYRRSHGFDEDFRAYKNAPKVGEFSIYPHLRLVEYLSNESKKDTFDTHAQYLFRLSSHFQNRNQYLGYNFPIPHQVNLGGTPLNDSLIALKTIIPTFKKKYGVEKLHVVTLTDGESNTIGILQKPNLPDDLQHKLYRGGLHGMAVVRDRKSGFHSKPSNDCHGGLTQQILKYLKYTFPETNFIGFRICNGSDASHFIRYSGQVDFEAEGAILKKWRKDKSLCLPNCNGYQELYLLNSTSLESDTDFEVKADATNAQIRSAFKKSLGAKANNKKVLSNFITQIA